MSETAVFGSRAVDWYRTLAIFALNALVLCAGLELAAFAIFELWSRSSSVDQEGGETDSRRKVSYYASKDWAGRYWDEHAKSITQRYHPYVGWRRAPFKGTTIEINEDGVRLTPGADCRATSFKVFIFGQSDLWGTGSPNWETIPAHLQKGLERLRPGTVCVTNFGESGYVSTQHAIMLLLQLRSGNVPDVIIVYDIWGDIYSAYQSGRAGVSQNLAQLAARFEQPREPANLLLDRLRATHSYALIDKLMGKLTIAKPQDEGPTPRRLVTYESMGVDAATLSDLIMQNYFGNYEIVSGLAQEYGFKYFFVIPPRLLMGDKPLTPEEQAMKRKLEKDADLSKLYTAVFRRIATESTKYRNFYSMTHVFDHVDSLVWIDGAHPTPMGNRMIATRMLDIIQGRFSAEK
jgi:hypothetical protein